MAHHASAFPAPSPYKWVTRGFGWVAVFAIVVWGPLANDKIVAAAPRAVAFALIALSLNILIGYTGQVSIGHQGFVGLGSMVAANIVTKYELPFGLSLLGAVVVAALFALVIGLVALRITGLYLALITLVFGVTLSSSLFQFQSLNGKGAGVNANRPAFMSVDNRYYWFCLVFLVVAMWLDHRLTSSKTGRALLALKENERVAAAFGINVTAYKLIAFTLSGALAGLAGALLGFYSQQFAPQDYTQGGALLALSYVVMTVVGGLGSPVGVVMGGAFFALLKDPLLPMLYRSTEWFGHGVPILKVVYGTNGVFVADLIGGVLLLVTLIFQPRGMATFFDPVARWLTGHKFEMHGEESGPAAVEGSSVRA
jgi:branched-chain amino acid transport system permease protein